MKTVFIYFLNKKLLINLIGAAIILIELIFPLKVILGLLFPPFINKLDFKSKEELQQMPQTEEEYLENQNLDYEEHEKNHADAEVSVLLLYTNLLYKFYYIFFYCLFILFEIIVESNKEKTFSLFKI